MISLLEIANSVKKIFLISSKRLIQIQKVANTDRKKNHSPEKNFSSSKIGQKLPPSDFDHLYFYLD